MELAFGWYEEPKDGKPKAIHYTEGGHGFQSIDFVITMMFGKKLLEMMNNAI